VLQPVGAASARVGAATSVTHVPASVIEVETLVQCAPERLFDLKLDMDAHSASLAATGETATTSSGSPQLDLGDEVTFRAKHFGLTWRMTSRVTAFDRPHRFVDQQVRGPFRQLRHEHTFEAIDPQTTRMTDRMELVAPFGPLGSLAMHLMLTSYLTKLLRTRAAAIKSLAEASQR
jgi:ligand-binding SRPBCC domain-containing protein